MADVPLAESIARLWQECISEDYFIRCVFDLRGGSGIAIPLYVLENNIWNACMQVLYVLVLMVW